MAAFIQKQRAHSATMFRGKTPAVLRYPIPFGEFRITTRCRHSVWEEFEPAPLSLGILSKAKVVPRALSLLYRDVDEQLNLGLVVYWLEQAVSADGELCYKIVILK